MWVFLIFLVIFVLIDLNANTIITPFYIIICAFLYAIYLIIHIKNRRKEKALLQSYIDGTTKAELNRITTKLQEDLSEFYITRGFAPSKEELNQITKRLMSYFEKDLPRQVLDEKLISFIPNITPSFLDFKSYMNLNTVRLIKRYVPNRWFDKISIASLTYCNLTEKDMHNIMALQKADIRPEEMHLYRFNYEQCAYAILYNTVLNIEPMSDDFTEEVRKDILQKILAGAEEEGYNLKDEYKNNY